MKRITDTMENVRKLPFLKYSWLMYKLLDAKIYATAPKKTTTIDGKEYISNYFVYTLSGNYYHFSNDILQNQEYKQFFAERFEFLATDPAGLFVSLNPTVWNKFKFRAISLLSDVSTKIVLILGILEIVKNVPMYPDVETLIRARFVKRTNG